MVRVLRRRYILFRIYSEDHLTRRDVEDIFRESTQSSSLTPSTRARMRLVLYYPDSGIGIARCDQETLPEIRKFLDSLSDTKLELHTLKTSGTIKALHRKVPRQIMATSELLDQNTKGF